MSGAFDDLIPAAAGGLEAGAFDDLIPAKAPPKRGVGFFEGFGRRAMDAMAALPETAAAIVGLAPLAVDKVAGTDLYDTYARNVIAPNTRAREYWQIDQGQEELTGAGKWGEALGALPRDLAAAIITGGQSAAPQAVAAAPTVAAAVRASLPAFQQGVRSMAVPAVVEGRDKYNRTREAGASETEAALSALNTSANMLVGGALPLATPGRIASRAAVGGAAGVAQAAEEKAVDNLILPESMRGDMTGEEAMMSAGPSALLAALLGPRASPSPLAQLNANRVRERANAQAAEELIRGQTVVPPEGQTVADVIAQVTGAKNRPESVAEWQEQQRQERQDRTRRGAELRQTFRGVDLPNDPPVPASAEQAVRAGYEAAGLDPDSVASAFQRGRAASEMDLPPAERDIRQRENSQEFARQAFDVAAARQNRADADLAQRGELAPDYQGGLAAATGGRMDGGTRRVTLLDGTEPVEIVGVADDGSIRVMVDDGQQQTVIDIPAKEVKTRLRDVDIPANQRLAQDFMERSSEPRRGVGVETMASERMPRRSTDRIAGDQVGGRMSAVDPVTRDGGSPPGEVLPPEPEGQRALPPGRVGDAVDGEVVREPGSAVVPAGPARGPTISTPDPRRQIGMDQPAPRLASPDAEEPGGRPSGRIIADEAGNARQEAETARQRQEREEGWRRQQAVDDYSRRDLGNTARNVGRTDTTPPPAPDNKPAALPAQRPARNAGDPIEVDPLTDDDAPAWPIRGERTHLDPTGRLLDGYEEIGRNPDGNIVLQRADGQRAVREGQYTVREADGSDPRQRVAEWKTEAELNAGAPSRTAGTSPVRQPAAPGPLSIFDDPPAATKRAASAEPVPPKTRDLRRELREAGGIDVSEAADMGFKNAAEGNRAFPGIFRRGGMKADGFVEWLESNGWMFPHDIQAADRSGAGGSHESARELLRDWLDSRGAGRPHPEDEGALYAFEQEAAEFERQRRVAAGLEDEAPSLEQSVADAIELARAKAESRGSDLSDEIPDALWAPGNEDALLRALEDYANDKGQDSARSRAEDSGRAAPREGAGGGDSGGGEGASPRAGAEGAGAGGSAGGDGKSEGGRVDGEQGFSLEGQTPEQVRAQEAKRRADEQRAAEDQRAAENKARADSEVAGFELTGQGIGPNADMFGNSPLLPEAAKDVQAAAELGQKIKGNPDAGRLNAGIPVDVLARELKKLADKWGIAKGVQELIRDLRTIATAGDVDKTREMAVPYLLRTVLGSTQGHMRALEAITGSEAMTKIRRHFDSKPGEGEGAEETYGEAIQRESVRFRNRLFDAMKQFLEDTPEAGAQRQQLARLLQNRGAIRNGSPLHDAAGKLAPMLDDILKHMKDAGVKVEATADYFPRVIDSMAVLRDKDGFLAAARAAYKAAGMVEDAAGNAAQAWHTAIVSGHHGISENPFSAVSNAVPTANMTKHRKMPKEAEETLRRFYVQDPLDALQIYIHKAVRRAEWERRFGGEVEFRDANGNRTKGTRMQALQAQLVAEGHEGIVPTMQRLVQAATGEVPNAVSARWRTAISWSHALTVIQYLRHAAITSLTEPILTGARTGNYADTARGYLYSLQDIQNRVAGKLGASWMENKTAREAKQIAEMLGHLESDLAASVHTVLQADGMLESSKIASKLAHRATIYSGLRQWTDATRSATMRVGMNFIGSLADDAAEGVRPALTKMHLADLGVPEARQKAFADWVRAGGKITDGSEMAQLYSKVIGRFMNQVIMQPTNADKPRYANHPVGSVAYGLTSYIYAFQNNVLNRMTRMVKQAIDPSNDFTARERVALLAPLMAIPMATIAQYALGHARDAVFGDEEKVKRKDKEIAFTIPGTNIDVPQRMAEAVSRSGAFGAADPWVNIVTSAKYERDPTTLLVGPVGANWQKLLMDSAKMFTTRNSPNTPTHERQIMKDVYNTMIDPVVSMAALYLPAPAGAAVNQFMARQATREGFARMAGDALHEATGL